MLKLYRVTKVKVLFLVLVYVFNFILFEFSAAILEKGLFIGAMSIRLLKRSHNPFLVSVFSQFVEWGFAVKCSKSCIKNRVCQQESTAQ